MYVRMYILYIWALYLTTSIHSAAFLLQEDGIETNNWYIHNLGVLTRGSSSLLNTDQIPATFWITNPRNIFIDNAAVASCAYGFWYDLDDHPSGPSFTTNVCPNKEPFGTFENNVAHTCSEFGLRIWETYVPYVSLYGAPFGTPKLSQSAFCYQREQKLQHRIIWLCMGCTLCSFSNHSMH